MISAFGIEHGTEVAKAAPGMLARLGTRIASGTESAGMGQVRAGFKGMRAAGFRNAGATQKPGRMLAQATRADVGGGMVRAGRAMARRPGLTGGLAVGGAGAAGLGGAAALHTPKKQKLTQYR
jgi:hypothetical protein